MNMIINIGAFGILTVLWLGFAAALIFNQTILDTVWQSFRGLPWVVQGVIWLLVLPVTAGLWIRETEWPLWLRLVVVPPAVLCSRRQPGRLSDQPKGRCAHLQPDSSQGPGHHPLPLGRFHTSARTPAGGTGSLRAFQSGPRSRI